MKNSRSKNAMLNIAFGYLAQFGILILSFVGRKIFLNFLSVEYLGINGLFSNILTVLALAELGLDAAVVYSLYKPVAEDDRPMIYSLITYFKKIYIGLALAIFAAGVALVPFLRFIVNSDLGQLELIGYYLLFLTNTVATYFVAHKVALITAAQEQRIQKIVMLSTNLLAQILHIIVLVLWHNYYIYIAVTVLTTILSSIIMGRICTRMHKDVFAEKTLVPFDKAPIKKKIFSTLIYKLGTVAVNNTSNILISVLVSTAAVGLYSNYFTVTSAVQGFIVIVTVSLISGIGNLAVKATKEKQYDFFNVILLAYHFIAALGGIGFALLFNELIVLWLGAEYLFEWHTVLVIALNFYVTNAISPIYMYREANGLFEKVRYLMLIRAAVNILLAVLLGTMWGTFGVLLATVLSMLLTNVWYEPIVLFGTVFGTSSLRYWGRQLYYFVLTVLSFALSYLAVHLISGSGLLYFAIKAMAILVIVSLVFLVFNMKSSGIAYMKGIFKRFLKKKPQTTTNSETETHE